VRGDRERGDRERGDREIDRLKDLNYIKIRLNGTNSCWAFLKEGLQILIYIHRIISLWLMRSLR
jgi:hypothetical protein